MCPLWRKDVLSRSQNAPGNLLITILTILIFWARKDRKFSLGNCRKSVALHAKHAKPNLEREKERKMLFCHLFNPAVNKIKVLSSLQIDKQFLKICARVLWNLATLLILITSDRWLNQKQCQIISPLSAQTVTSPINTILI